MGREIREMERDRGTQTKAELAGEVQSQTQGDGEGQAEKDLKRGRLGRGGGTVGREWGMEEMETGAGAGGGGGPQQSVLFSKPPCSHLSNHS